MTTLVNTDLDWMQQCIELAKQAEQAGEVPVGALIVCDGGLIAEGWNQPVASHDPTAHAEIVALRHAGRVLENYRLLDTTLYVTLEPCAMCISAIVHARVKRLVFGAYDPKAGAVSSVFQLLDQGKLNHQVDWQGGLMQAECGQLLRDFFQARRC